MRCFFGRLGPAACARCPRARLGAACGGRPAAATAKSAPREPGGAPGEAPAAPARVAHAAEAEP